MVVRRVAYAAVMVLAVCLAGCAFLDGLFTPKTAPGESGKSNVEEFYDKNKDAVPVPYREIVGWGILGLQNLYLGGRRAQTMVRNRRKKTDVPA